MIHQIPTNSLLEHRLSQLNNNVSKTTDEMYELVSFHI